MGPRRQPYRKHEVVRVGSSHDEEHLRGMEAVIVGDRMTDSRGVSGYSAWVLREDELWYFREEDLQETGRMHAAEGTLYREGDAAGAGLDAAEGGPS